MPEDVQHRFDMLRGRFVDAQYLVDYYGLDGLAGNANLLADIARYRGTLRNIPDTPPGEFDRYVLEGFLQTRRLLPIKWAAARLGMKPTLLTTILGRRMDLPTPLRSEYLEYDCLIEEGLAEDFVRALPQFRFRTFSDHESFCERLHVAVGQSLAIPDAEINEGKLWCATDQALSEVGLGDYPPRYGYHFDCLTCEQLSGAHAMWLDFRKPLALGPDRCSKLVFVRHRQELQAWIAGTRAPDDLEKYEEYVTVAH
jgi:hypothetical protein